MADALILRPHVMESLDWVACGMTTRELSSPGEDRIELARRLPDVLGCEPADRPAVCVCEQVHGDQIATVGEDGLIPVPGEVTEVPAVDGLIAREPGLLVGVYTADCVPVIIADMQTRQVAAVHAGREGTLLGITRKVIEQMISDGAEPENMVAWVGPSISVDHYEVSEELAARFRDRFAHYPGAVRGPELRHLALGVANWAELIACGIPMAQIELDARCTFENTEYFYSYRRDGKETGRMLTFIGLV